MRTNHTLPNHWNPKTTHKKKRRKKHGSWANLKGGGQLRRQGGEWGTDARDGARTGVSERLPSQPRGNVGTVRIRLRRAVEGGLYEHAQPYIRAALMMGVFSCICYGVLWRRVGLQCRILGGVIVSVLG